MQNLEKKIISFEKNYDDEAYKIFMDDEAYKIFMHEETFNILYRL